MMWLDSGASEDPEDKSQGEMYRAEPQHSAVQCVIHDIITGDSDVQQDVTQRIIQI